MRHSDSIAAEGHAGHAKPSQALEQLEPYAVPIATCASSRIVDKLQAKASEYSC